MPDIHFQGPSDCLYKGTSATRGTRDTRLSRVVRHGILCGLDDTVGSYRAALDFAEGAYSIFDPIEWLPRQRIRVVKLSGDKALVTVEYKRTPNMPDIDNMNAMERAACTSDWESIQWYSKYPLHGTCPSPPCYPSTNWATSGTSGTHPRTQHTASVWRFVATMVYGSSPLTLAIRNMHGKVNDATFQLGGVGWPQFCVRFDGMKMQSERIGGYTVYNVEWHFAVREDGWWAEQNNNDVEIDELQMYDDVPLSVPTGWVP